MLQNLPLLFTELISKKVKAQNCVRNQFIVSRVLFCKIVSVAIAVGCKMG
jgi:hypothetical protein